MSTIYLPFRTISIISCFPLVYAPYHLHTYFQYSYLFMHEWHIFYITLPTNRAKLEPFDKTNAGNLHKQAFGISIFYSSSIVPGGLLVRSYITRLTPFTSLIILVITLCNTSNGMSAQSAVMKSLVHTARSATA